MLDNTASRSLVDYLQEVGQSVKVSDPYIVPDGLARSIWEDKYSRKIDGKFQTWEERIREVVLGNFLLSPNDSINLEEYKETIRLSVEGVICFSGRHVQHGDETQPNRLQEFFSNCSSSPFCFLTFLKGLFGCFRKGTLIKMADETYKEIDTIKIGDEVLSFNMDISKFEKQKVLAIHTNEPKAMVKVTLDDDTEIICTEDHKFILQDGREVMAKDLEGENVRQMI